MTILLTCLVNTSNLKQVKPSGFSGDHDAKTLSSVVVKTDFLKCSPPPHKN
jgi:hypothetical protein